MSAVYTDTPTLKSYLSKDARVVDDAWLGVLLGSAESTIRKWTGHDYGNLVTGTKTYSTLGHRRVRVVDAQNITAVTVAGASLLPNYWYLDTGLSGEPAQWITLLMPVSVTYSALGFYANGINDLSITGQFGWKPAPDEIVDATYVLAARYHKERGHEYSDAVQTETGLMTYFSQLPGRVQEAVRMAKTPNIILV